MVEKKDAVAKSTTCNGFDFVVRVNQIAPGMIQQMRSHCSDCESQGEIINAKNKCKTCDGKKLYKKEKSSKFILIKVWKMERR